MASDRTVNVSDLTTSLVPWKKCILCNHSQFGLFKSPREFCRHLREYHCSKEGGSFVCKYGLNGVCPSLPVDGVSDRDYEDHVSRDHVAGENEGNKGTNQPRKRETLGSSSPTHPAAEPSIVQDQHKWTMYMSQVNLPAALNDPRLTRREADFFTKTWGESFEKTEIPPAPNLPKISKEHFRKYLKKTSSRLKEHQRHQSTSNPPESSLPTDDFPVLLTRKIDKHKAALEQIPKMFMHPGFNLENPETFGAVFPWTQVEPGRQEKDSHRQSSKLLQEKLHHYLDVVEVQIAKQISLRSEAFFHAMTSHDQLQADMATTCKCIQHLRERVRSIDSMFVRGPLQILKDCVTRSNYVQLYNKLKLMSTVHQTQPTIQLLLSTNEFVGSLDLISTTQEVLAQELQGLVCFRHLGSQLAEMEKLIDKMMQEDFAKYANQDLNRPVDDGSAASEEDRLVAIVLGLVRQQRFNFIDVYREEAGATLKAILKQTVIESVSECEAQLEAPDPNVTSLADQMRQLNYVQWMQLLSRVFTNLLVIINRVKSVSEIMLEVLQLAAGRHRHLSASSETSAFTNNNKTTAQSPQNSGLPNGINEATISLEEGQMELQRMNAEMDRINDIGGLEVEEQTVENSEDFSCSLDKRLSSESQLENGLDENGVSGSEESCGDNQVEKEPVTPKESTSRISVGNDLDVLLSYEVYVDVSHAVREMLCQVCDNAHNRCEKVLNARAKDGFLERLNSAEFVQLSRNIEGFVSDCEQVCGRKSTSLRACLQSQAIKFVSRFHDERKTKLSLILDNERWKQADVPTDFQDLVNHISKSGKLNVPDRRNSTADRPAGEFLFVEKEQYAVVGTVLMLLKMVVEYCQCTVDIPTVTSDILTRLIELLKIFNSRSCQLILGAGALQLVGLKTITTKNLALASRCLQLVTHYLPKVRLHFETRLHGKQANMLKHFDHVLKDYKDHIAELANKLVAIMDSMFDVYLAKWEVRPPMPSVCFRNICKQISKLHEAISDLLPQSQVTAIFQRVHSSFKVHLRGQLIKLGVTNDGGPQHGLVASDVAFYKGNLKSLQGLAQIVDNMEDIWDKG